MAQLSAAGQGRGRPRPVNDNWIAACLAYGLPLATLNRRDFDDFAPAGPTKKSTLRPSTLGLTSLR